jgi:hypothetical protein
MKIRNTLVLLLLATTFIAYSQNNNNTITTQEVINWLGVEKWHANAQSKSIISFQDAVYPTGDYLPYFNKKIPVDAQCNYEISAKQYEYIAAGSDEIELINRELLTESPVLNYTILSDRTNQYADISLFPFVLKNNQILKVKSFELTIKKNSQALKVSKAGLHSYAQNSVLAEGRFTKIRIVNSGVYKLTYEDLNSMGINPANVRIFGYGGHVLDQNFMNAKIDDLPEVAIYMNKGSDGVFNAGDYILFYGNGVNKWKYSTTEALYTNTINTYSNYGYYFVTSDAGSGKKIESAQIDIPSGATIAQVEEFTDYAVYEKEAFNIAESGKVFYGNLFYPGSSLSIPFNFPNTIPSSTVKLKTEVAASALAMSTFSLTLNNEQNKTMYVSKKSETDAYEKGKSVTSTFNYTYSGDDLNFALSYANSNSSAKGYLNYVVVNVRRSLKMSGSAMQFQYPGNLNTGKFNQFLLSDANANVQIWDITDTQHIYQIATTNSNGKLAFTDNGTLPKTYLAIDPTSAGSFSKPEIVGVIPNQNLHALSAIDMVILTHPDFVSQAETLAQAHREIDNLSVAVVTTEQVYNEFSSGAPDATAYRWIMKMLYDRAIASGNSDDMPKYLLLFGRGTYDNRKVISSSGDNLILTYQAEQSLIITDSYVTDDYFGYLDDNEGTNVTSHLLDIGIGRFPVQNSEQATQVVNKTIRYMKNETKGAWKNQLCFVADDGDYSLHMSDADSIASMIARKYPAYQVSKIYLDSYTQEITATGEAYPEARKQFLDKLQKGLFLLNYTGHAGITGWANESILTTNDIYNLSNKQLPLWMAATCDFLQFDTKALSAGEQVLLNEQGGGIGVLSAARPVYANKNFSMNRFVSDNMFSNEHYRIGDIVRMSKNSISAEINKLTYIYMGDPAVRLNYPTDYNISTTAINGNTDLSTDTLKALSIVNVKGIVADNSGNKATDFNGTLNAVVYDKMQKITTLNNHNEGAFTYKNRPNILFAGKATVVDGEFDFSFMMPKDIKFNYGTGRINYYASDSSTGLEGQGYNESFIVGGTSEVNSTDTIGPEIQIYLNSTEFVSGGKVNETPLFIAKLNDPNGINRSGSGIGHDLTITIDNDPKQAYVLNDYFESEANSYTAGTIKYKLNELENGKHTLKFKAWDLLNNSSSASLDFVVVKGLTPVIFTIKNYPNPVKTGSTTIEIEHDRPETVLSTTVDIFDLSGRLVWSFKQPNADEISWDLIGSNGTRVKPGIYLYRVSIKTKVSDIFSKTNKLLVIQ